MPLAFVLKQGDLFNVHAPTHYLPGPGRYYLDSNLGISPLTMEEEKQQFATVCVAQRLHVHVHKGQ